MVGNFWELGQIIFLKDLNFNFLFKQNLDLKKEKSINIIFECFIPKKINLNLKMNFMSLNSKKIKFNFAIL